MMSKTKVNNDAPSHKYFTQMLNIAEDDLDPFQYRLLAHYVRWTGHGNGTDESIRTAAKATKMGINKVRSTLNELSALGYITYERPTPQEARNGKTIHITVLDRWEDNILRYKKPVSNPIQGNEKPVSNQIHPPVSKTIRLEEQDTEEPKEDISLPKVKGRKPDPQYDLIAKIWGINAGGWVSNIQGMIFGSKKVKGEWLRCEFEPHATIEELQGFEPYLRKRMSDKNIKDVPTAAVTIQRWFYDYRCSLKPKEVKINPETGLPDIPELRGIKKIIR